MSDEHDDNKLTYGFFIKDWNNKPFLKVEGTSCGGEVNQHIFTPQVVDRSLCLDMVNFLADRLTSLKNNLEELTDEEYKNRIPRSTEDV